MDDRQHFKAAFIARCIDAGFTTPEQITALVKSAMEKQAIPVISQALDLGKSLISTGASWAVPLALAGPPLAGAAAGHLAAKATDVDDFDVDEAKRQEVIDEYRRQTARLKREGLVRRQMAGGGIGGGRPMF